MHFQQKFIRNARSNRARLGIPSPHRHVLNTCIRSNNFYVPLNSYSLLLEVYFPLFLQREISEAGDVAMKFYYDKFPNTKDY